MTGPGDKTDETEVIGSKATNVISLNAGGDRTAKPVFSASGGGSGAFTGGSGVSGGGPMPPTADELAKAKAVENERWKYLSTFINTVAAASIAIGFLTPTSAILAKGPSALSDLDAAVYAGMTIISIFLAAALHSLAQYFLGNLEP